MKFALADRTRNLAFYTILCIGILCTLVAATEGSQQDVTYNSYYSLYQQGNGSVAQGNFAEAGQIFSTLLQSHPDSYMLMWQYAYCLGQQGHYAQAAQFYTKTRMQKPYIVQNQQFLYAAGENFLRLGQSTEAYKYLSRAASMNTDPAVTSAAQALVNQLDKSKVNKGD